MGENIQQQLFSRIKEKLQPGTSVVDAISEILCISQDSTYRRIRGEKLLSIDEVHKLCRTYKIRFDQLAGAAHEDITFSYVGLEDQLLNTEQYLLSIIRDLEFIAGCPDKEIIYMSKDIPMMQLFHIPEIAAFKIFFWEKSIAELKEREQAKFSFAAYEATLKRLGDTILSHYLKIPTLEIWNEETILSLLYQVKYYWESGYFKSREDALTLCQSIEKFTGHIRDQARTGFKFVKGSAPNGIPGNYQLYVNDLVLPDNTILVRIGDNRRVYLSHNVMNYLSTADSRFCERTHHTLKNLIKRSTLVSSVGERERNKLFQSMEEKIHGLKKKIENA